MILSINQPAYLPWPGYFDRILRSDLHIVLDHVQYEKNSLINRNKIRTANNWMWLTVPVSTKGKFGDLAVGDLEIVGHNWQRKHLAAIIQNYSKAPFLTNHIEFLERIYSTEWQYLAALIRKSNDYLLAAFNIKTPIRYSSALNPSGTKDDLILNLCQYAGASTYISGPLGRNYLNLEKFDALGIKVLFHDYCQKEYTQAYWGFEPYMSALDLLLNHGPNSGRLLGSSDVCQKTIALP